MFLLWLYALMLLKYVCYLHVHVLTYSCTQYKLNLYNIYQNQYLHNKLLLLLLLLILFSNATSIQTDINAFTVFYFYC